MRDESGAGRVGEAAVAGAGDGDAAFDSWLDRLGDVKQARERRAALAAVGEEEYLARTRGGYEEELQARREAGEDVDGIGEVSAEGVNTGKAVRQRIAADVEAGERITGRRTAAAERPGPDGDRVPRTEGAQVAVAKADPAEEEAGGSASARPDPEAGGADRDEAPWIRETAPPAPPASPPGEPPGVPVVRAEVVHVAVDRAAVAALSGAIEAGIGELGALIDQAVNDLKGAAPEFRSGDVGKLVEGVKQLGDRLRIEESDRKRRAELGRTRWKWPLRALAAAAGIGLLVGGAAIQARWSVLDDPLNQWKGIVWDRHGMMIADCIDRAERRGGGARCRVSLEVR